MATSQHSADASSHSSSAPGTPDRHGFYSFSTDASKPKKRLSHSKLLAAERKWLYMLDNWPLYIAKNYKKIRDRCRKGIPMSLRPRAWFYLSGAYLLKKKNPNLYNELLSKPLDQKHIEDIETDATRGFDNHVMFHNKKGVIDRMNVLKAYMLYNPKMSYSQPQSTVAAFLLMHYSPEDAFWVFVSVCDIYMDGYYGGDIEVIQIEFAIMSVFLKKIYPVVFDFLKQYHYPLDMYVGDWYHTLMIHAVPWDTVLRIWDCFLAEGITVIFKVILVILGATLGRSKVRQECTDLLEIMRMLKSLPPEVVEEEFIIQNMQRLNLRVEDFQIEHTRQKQRFAKEKALMEAASTSGATKGSRSPKRLY